MNDEKRIVFQNEVATVTPRVPASSEPRPENPYFEGEGHNDLHGAWNEGSASRQPEIDRLEGQHRAMREDATRALSNAYAERDEARADAETLAAWIEANCDGVEVLRYVPGKPWAVVT